jgi:hypothetical protein
MRKLAFLISFMLLLTGMARADWWPVHALPRTLVHAEVTAIYDDNPFKYSDGDLNEFDAGLRSYRFPIETRDDLAVRGALGFDLNLESTRIELDYRGYQYLSNSMKSYSVFLGRVTRKLGSQLAAELAYRYLPDYMIRHYPAADSGPRVYLPCTFSQHLGRAGLRAKIGRVTLGVFGEIGRLDYDETFEHYDTDLMGGLGEISYRPVREFYLTLTYAYRQNSAKGTDLADRPDISNDRHTAKVLLRKRGFLLPDLGLSLSFRYRLRVFTSNKPYAVDPFHSGREDTEYRGALSLDYEINRRFSILARYALESRSTTSPAKDDIDEVKDYTRNVGSLGLRFTL